MSLKLENALIDMLKELARLFEALRETVNAERGQFENAPIGEVPNPKKKKR